MFCYNAGDSCAIGIFSARRIANANSREFETAGAAAPARRDGNYFYVARLPEAFHAHARHDALLRTRRFPGYFAYIAGVIEFFGGITLILGLFTRISGLLIAGEMLIAVWRVHLPQGPITQVKNYEFPMVLAAAAFTLATVGAGMISLDHAIYGGGRKAPRRGKEKD